MESSSISEFQLSKVGQELALDFVNRYAQGKTPESESERTDACLLLVQRLNQQPQTNFSFLWAISVGLEHANKMNQQLQVNFNTLREEAKKVVDWARAANLVLPPPRPKETIEFTEDAEGKITGARVFTAALEIHPPNNRATLERPIK